MVGMTEQQFLRALLRKHRGEIKLARPKDAPNRRPLSNKDHVVERMAFNLQPDLFGYLHELGNRSGNINRSAVMASLLLSWCSINPLD